jgi:hypothetical protein
LVLRCLASNACHVRLSPILESTDPTSRAATSIVPGRCNQARCSIDPSLVEMGAAEGTPCCSAPTGSRAPKAAGTDCWHMFDGMEICDREF